MGQAVQNMGESGETRQMGTIVAGNISGQGSNARMARIGVLPEPKNSSSKSENDPTNSESPLNPANARNQQQLSQGNSAGSDEKM